MKKVFSLAFVFLSLTVFSQSIYNSAQLGQTGRNQNVSRGFWVKSGTFLLTSTFWMPASGGAGKVFTSDANGFGAWQHFPTSFIYMFSEDTSTISGYYQAIDLASFTAGNLKTKATAGVSTTPTLLEEFATAELDAFTIPAGIIHFHIESQKTAGSNSYYLYFELYQRDVSNTETLILTSDNTSSSALNTNIQQSTTGLLSSNTPIDATDRLVVKVYGVMLSSTATITLKWDSITEARFEFNAPTNGNNSWKLTGNSGTNPSTNFIGTTDGAGLYVSSGVPSVTEKAAFVFLDDDDVIDIQKYDSLANGLSQVNVDDGGINIGSYNFVGDTSCQIIVLKDSVSFFFYPPSSNPLTLYPTALKIDIPSKGVNKVLTSDANGGATWQNPDSLLPYRKYVALLSQTGTNAPTAIVLENTMGATLTWNYGAVGHYTATSSNIFAEDKTVWFISPLYPNGIGNYSFEGGRMGINTFGLDGYINGVASDDMFDALSIEIRVYK